MFKRFLPLLFILLKLTHSPAQLIYFHKIRKRHTNFALEPISFNKSNNIFGKNITFHILPYGDFERPVYVLKIVLPPINKPLFNSSKTNSNTKIDIL